MWISGGWGGVAGKVHDDAAESRRKGLQLPALITSDVECSDEERWYCRERV